MSGYKDIKRVINSFPKGSIFFPKELSVIASSDTVRSSLERLCEENFIIRLGQGVYYYPETDDKWGMGILYPSLDKIAKAIAKRDHCEIAPTGSYALNVLGLSTQLPTNVVYYTNGSPRKVNIGNGRGILFKRSGEMKRFSFASETMSLIVTALREIGNGKVTETEKAKLALVLKKVSPEDYNHDLYLAPLWVQKLLTEIR